MIVVECFSEIEQWEADRLKPNPFHSRVNAPTQSSIRLALAQEETCEIEKGHNISLHTEVSPSILVSSGLDLEEQQRRLYSNLSALGEHSTDIQKTKAQREMNSLQCKIDSWVTVQLLYMPIVAILRARAASAMASNGESVAKVEPHKFKLWLPSELGCNDTCDVRLRENEWRLRYAQAHDTLNQVRQFLRLQSHLFKFKGRNLRGQGPNTRARNVLKNVDTKLQGCVKKYQTARSALQALSKVLGRVGWESTLKELTKDDLRSMTDLVDGETEGRKKLTWIWRTAGVEESDNEGLQDAVRMEWCRTRARAMRWSEEVDLLQEEMRRVLQYFAWHAAWWEEQGMRRFTADKTLAEGLFAYASRQADIRHHLADTFRELWGEVPSLIASAGTVSPPM
ncbi:hypothetical protein BJ138DRAFT_1120962 [Hygrophoropsis aurantiaca]|uniref:Uncharacterized protein n=1 Tax=Hygrophoropsis aurantiaca TaxID=72124 RepID=A0ACB7ZP11_9AGAM|nr:hypothetical protein BJ138DRAFT_1120962 [Hygrophoropsis aurantiaca]